MSTSETKWIDNGGVAVNPEISDYTEKPMIYPYPLALWRYDETVSEDTVTNGLTGIPEEKRIALPVYPDMLWRIDLSRNSGLPFHDYIPLADDYHVKPVKQHGYICIFDMDTPQDGFEGHGLCILTPTACNETEILNGIWTVQLTHPIDEDGRWQYIQERNILKVEGQLFTIIAVEHDWKGNSGSVTAKAEHVFYQQNDSWIYEGARITGDTGAELLNSMDLNTERNDGPESIIYRFTHSSDLSVPAGVSTNKWNPITDGGITPTDLILGNSGIASLLGGELYRDNFYYSINARMEYADDNAFDIRVGLNLKGIRRTVDVTTMCAYFRGYGEAGWYAISWVTSSLPRVYPHSIIRSKRFNFYIDDDTLPEEGREEARQQRLWDLLVAESNAYFSNYCAPLVSYVVDLEDVSTNPDFEELSNHFDYKVGNKGRLTDFRLGGSVWLTITKTEKDRISGKTTSVTFGDLRSFTRPSGYRTAIANLQPEPVGIFAQARDADGNYCFDSASGVCIVRSDV